MTDSDEDSESATGQSSTQSADDTDTDQLPSKYVIGDSPVGRIADSLTAAAEAVDGPLTIESYEQWREQATRSHASPKQITHHSDHGDTWVDICGSLGITTSHTYDCSRETIREALHDAAQAVGEPLEKSDYDAWRTEQSANLPTPRLIQNQFDKDWREVCEAVGIQPHSGRQYTTRDIKTALQDAATELGEPLTSSAYQSWARTQPADRPSPSTITRVFADWVTACTEAGVNPHRKARHTLGNPYTEAEIIGAVQAAADATGEPLSPSEYNEWQQSQPGEFPSKRTCLRRFETWDNVCETADIRTGKRSD